MLSGYIVPPTCDGVGESAPRKKRLKWKKTLVNHALRVVKYLTRVLPFARATAPNFLMN
jgi:hypothetical protein